MTGRKEQEQAPGGGDCTMGLGTRPLPVGQSRHRPLQQHCGGSWPWMTSRSIPIPGAAWAEDEGTGSPTHRAANACPVPGCSAQGWLCHNPTTGSPGQQWTGPRELCPSARGSWGEGLPRDVWLVPTRVSPTTPGPDQAQELQMGSWVHPSVSGTGSWAAGQARSTRLGEMQHPCSPA